jgi:outer membrane immunogenic protein
MRFRHATAGAAVLTLMLAARPALADPPYSGWRGTSSGYSSPSYAGGDDIRPLDGSRRTSSFPPAYAPPSYATSPSGYYPPPQDYPTRLDRWGGLYVGGHVGGVWSGAGVSGSVPSSIVPSGTSIDDSIGAAGLGVGGHLGYNIQMGQVVAGFELDADWTNAEGTANAGALGQVHFANSWLSSARARLGWAFDNWLIYATGGLAVTNADLGYATTSFQGFGLSGATNNMLVGYALGAGVEVKLSNDFSARLEAIHYGFGSQGYDLPGVGQIKTDADATTVRVGLSYHLN